MCARSRVRRAAEDGPRLPAPPQSLISCSWKKKEKNSQSYNSFMKWKWKHCVMQTVDRRAHNKFYLGNYADASGRLYSHQDGNWHKTEVVFDNAAWAIDCRKLFHCARPQQVQCQLFLIHMDIDCWQPQESDWLKSPSVHWKAWREENQKKYKTLR